MTPAPNTFTNNKENNMVKIESYSCVLYIGIEVLDIKHKCQWIDCISIQSGKIQATTFVETLREIQQENDTEELPTDAYIEEAEKWIAREDTHEAILKVAMEDIDASEIIDSVLLGQKSDRGNITHLRNRIAQLAAPQFRFELKEKLGEWF